MRSCLIVNMARFGDLVQMIPMVQSLRRVYPDIQIGLLSHFGNREACTIIPGINEVFVFDASYMVTCLYGSTNGIESAYEYIDTFFKRLRSRGFERVVNITPHYIGVLASFLAGHTPTLQHVYSDWSKFYCATTRCWRDLPFHVSDLFASIAGVQGNCLLPSLALSPADFTGADELLQGFLPSPGIQLIGIHTGGSTIAKRWPADKYIALCELLVASYGAKIVFVGNDSGCTVSKICHERFPDNVLDCTHKTTPGTLAAMMSKIKLIITGDSGPMHVAAAAGTQVISLHTGKETCFTTGPYGKGHIAIEPAIGCHPCVHPDSCTRRQCHDCITPEMVFNITAHVLAESDPGSACAHADKCMVQVYESDFDVQGYLEYFPVPRSPLNFKTMLRAILRTMWAMDLNRHRTTAGHLPDEGFDEAVRKIAGDVRLHYAQWDRNQIEISWGITISTIDALTEYARHGHSIATVMAQTQIITSNDELAYLKKSADKLERIDRDIISTGDTLDHCSTLTQMFAYEKETVEGKDLRAMALETCRVYENLRRRCRLLRNLGDALVRCLRDDSGDEHWRSSRDEDVQETLPEGMSAILL